MLAVSSRAWVCYSIGKLHSRTCRQIRAQTLKIIFIIILQKSLLMNTWILLNRWKFIAFYVLRLIYFMMKWILGTFQIWIRHNPSLYVCLFIRLSLPSLLYQLETHSPKLLVTVIKLLWLKLIKQIMLFQQKCI